MQHLSLVLIRSTIKLFIVIAKAGEWFSVSGSVECLQIPIWQIGFWNFFLCITLLILSHSTEPLVSLNHLQVERPFDIYMPSIEIKTSCNIIYLKKFLDIVTTAVLVLDHFDVSLFHPKCLYSCFSIHDNLPSHNVSSFVISLIPHNSILNGFCCNFCHRNKV